MESWNNLKNGFVRRFENISEKIGRIKYILPILIVVFIFVLGIYITIIHRNIERTKFAKAMESIVERNANPTFNVEKIYLCSSANAIDNTQEQNLENLNIYQYTDIAIYLNNHSQDGLTNKNTVKELYIDNINIQLDYNIGKTSLGYTNLLKIGLRSELENFLKKQKNAEDKEKEEIRFKIVSTNEENANADYNNPTFYADCSNPITLKYVNKLNKTYSIQEDDIASFDGSILEKVAIKPEDINAKIKFKINLVNNDDEYYNTWINFRIPLNDIYEGTSIKSRNTEGNEYIFFI